MVGVVEKHEDVAGGALRAEGGEASDRYYYLFGQCEFWERGIESGVRRVARGLGERFCPGGTLKLKR